MKSDDGDTVSSDRKSPEGLAELLIRLFDERFGGASSGKFRISRKYLRKLAGRRKLADSYLQVLANEIFEYGYVFVDCESYSIVLSQKQFTSYRRVTDVAANKVLSKGEAKIGATSGSDKGSEQPEISEVEEKFA